MSHLPTKKIIERLFTVVLASTFLVGCLLAYQTYFGKTALLLPAQATLPVSTEPVFVAGVEPEIQWLAMAEKNDETLETTFKATGLGVPEFEVRRRMSVLAYQAHENKSPTPGGLGSYGCAVAIWHHVIRPALVAAYPEKAKLIPVQLQHTQQILNFYKKYKLGTISHVPAFDLTPDKTPPGTVIIGIKKDTRDEHMLVAVDVNWGSVKNPKTGKTIYLKRDGKTDAYAGNTGLKQFGSPHFRIQEFASNLGFLNSHHGAINSLSKNNYYEEFVVLTF
ncbi:MAG: hypothetical protein NTW61_09215 [Candidatus Melainabacteria bacterium]|nr:hypothetical protein [Candidatus Melainabacteria bacterium]